MHCVVFRTGGTENAHWHRSLPMTYDEACAACMIVKRMGFQSHVEDYKFSVNLGLPEGFSYFGKRAIS